MPGRTPPDAFRAFAGPLAEALGCIAVCKITPSAGGRADPGHDHQLLVNGGEKLALAGPERLSLNVRMRYRFITDEKIDGGPWKVQTLAYSYTITDAAGSEIVSFHWHPDGTSHMGKPHLHLGHTQLRDEAVLTSKQHVPTGRISLEQVVHVLIAEHAVPARCDDWEQRLALTRGLFELHRSWS